MSAKFAHSSMILTASHGARTVLAKMNGKYGSRLSVSVIVLCVLVIAVFSLHLSSRKYGAFAVNHFAQGEPQKRPTPSGLDGELVVLRNRGFEPSEITRPAGPFLLGVDARIGANEADIALSRVAGGRVGEKSLPKGVRAWREQVDLPPGQYVLTVADRPNAVCKITITPR